MVGYRRVVALSVSIIGALAEDEASNWDFEQVAYGPGLPNINAIAKYVSRFYSIVGGAHLIKADNTLENFADGAGNLHVCSNEKLLKGEALATAGADMNCIAIGDKRFENKTFTATTSTPFTENKRISTAACLGTVADFIHGSETYHPVESKDVIQAIFDFIGNNPGAGLPEVPLNLFYQSEDVLSHNGILKITDANTLSYTWFPEFDPKKVIQLYNHTMPCTKNMACGTETSGIFKVVNANSTVDSFGAAMVYYTTVLTITNAAVNGFTQPAAIACTSGLPAVGKIMDSKGVLLTECTEADFCADSKDNKHTLIANCGADHSLKDISTARKFNDDHRYGLLTPTTQTAVFDLFKHDKWIMTAAVTTSTQNITYKKFTENSKWDLNVEIVASAGGAFEPAFKIVPGEKSDIVTPQEDSLKDSFRYLFESNSSKMGDDSQALELVDSDRHRRMLVSKFVGIYYFIAPYNDSKPAFECNTTSTTSLFPNDSLTIILSDTNATENSYTTAATATLCKKFNLGKLGELLRKIPDQLITYTPDDGSLLSLDVSSNGNNLVFKSDKFLGDDVGKYVTAQGKLFDANIGDGTLPIPISKVGILNPARLGDFQRNIDSILGFDEQTRYAGAGGSFVYGLFKGKNRDQCEYGLDYNVDLVDGNIGMLVSGGPPSRTSTIKIAATLTEGTQAGKQFTGLKNVTSTNRESLILLSHLLCDYNGATHDNVDKDDNVSGELAVLLSAFSFNNNLGTINAASGLVTVKHTPITIAVANQAAYAFQKGIYLATPGVAPDNIFKNPSLLTTLSDALKVVNAYTLSTIGVTMTSWVKEDCFARGKTEQCDTDDGDGYQITSEVGTVTFTKAVKSDNDVSIPTKESATPSYLSQQKVLELWNLHAVKSPAVTEINALLKRFMGDGIAVGVQSLSHEYMNLTIGDASIAMSAARYGVFSTLRAAAASFTQAYDIAMHTSSGGGGDAEDGPDQVTTHVKVDLFEYPSNRPRYYDLERYLLSVQIFSGMMETIGHAGLGNTLRIPTKYFGATDASHCILTGKTVEFKYEESDVKYWTGLVTGTIISETTEDKNSFLVCPVLVHEQAAYDINTDGTREAGKADRERLVTSVEALAASDPMTEAAVASISKYINVGETNAVLYARPTKASYNISLKEGNNIKVTVTPNEKDVSTRKPILEAFHVAGEVFKAQIDENGITNSQCTAFLFYLVKYHYAVLRLISAVPVLFTNEATSKVVYRYDNMYECGEPAGSSTLMLNVEKVGDTVTVLHNGTPEAPSGINKVWCKSNQPPVEADKIITATDSQLLSTYLDSYTSMVSITLTLQGVGHKPDPTKPFFTSYADIEFKLEAGKYTPSVILTKPYADSSAAFSFHTIPSTEIESARLEAIARVTLIDMIQQLVIGSTDSKFVEPELIGTGLATGTGVRYKLSSEYMAPTSEATGKTSFTLSLTEDETADRTADGSVTTYYSESRIFEKGISKDVYEVLGVPVSGKDILAVDVFNKITEMAIPDYSMRFLPVVRQEYMYSIPIYGTLKTVDSETGKKFEIQHAESDKATCFHGPDYHFIAQGLHDARIAAASSDIAFTKEWNYRFLIIALYIATSSHTVVAVTGDGSLNYGIDVDQTLVSTNNNAAFFASAFGKTLAPENPDYSPQTGWIVINITSSKKNFSVGPPVVSQEDPPSPSEILRFEDTAEVYQGFSGVTMDDGKDLPSFAVKSIVETFKKTNASGALKAKSVRGAYEGEASTFEVNFSFVDGKMVSSSGISSQGSSANIIMKSCLSVCIALFLGVVAIM